MSRKCMHVRMYESMYLGIQVCILSAVSAVSSVSAVSTVSSVSTNLCPYVCLYACMHVGHKIFFGTPFFSRDPWQLASLSAPPCLKAQLLVVRPWQCQ